MRKLKNGSLKEQSPPKNSLTPHSITKKLKYEKKTLITLVLLLIGASSFSQLDKKTWLVGGNANFSSGNFESGISIESKQTKALFAPNIGYFFYEKLVSGLKLSYGHNKVSFGSVFLPLEQSTYSFGPFIRYYLLEKEKLINILVESSYMYGNLIQGSQIIGGGKTNTESSTFNIMAGPVVYFNSSVGLEFLVGYSVEKYKKYSGSNKNFTVGIGFQFYLQK